MNKKSMRAVWPLVPVPSATPETMELRKVPVVPAIATLHRVPSGTIDIAVGADGVYLQFNCDCRDALPYCKAACCCLPGIDVTLEELADLKPATTVGPDGPTMRRSATGWCCENDPGTRFCTLYDSRPQTCRDFHCSRGEDMRGWRLGLERHKE